MSQIKGNTKNQFHVDVFTITIGNLNFYSKIFIKCICHHNKKHESIRYKSNKIVSPCIYWKLQELMKKWKEHLSKWRYITRSCNEDSLLLDSQYLISRLSVKEHWSRKYGTNSIQWNKMESPELHQDRYGQLTFH